MPKTPMRPNSPLTGRAATVSKTKRTMGCTTSKTSKERKFPDLGMLKNGNNITA
ncbi:hypothetical protein A2U01_0014684, partial [Trifolium medium]|nr:hypothetical protein [Trifolium medium]